jgi:UDP-N-acetylglucosamine 2-epimerase
MKIVTVIGARPQFIKAAMLSKRLRQVASEIIVHTGQHYDENMSAIFFNEMSIPKPDHNLGIGGGTHAEQTGMMMIGIERILMAEKPDWVLVYGDTNSTLAGALAGVKLHIPVGHVEAGLRSFNNRMPEEINRILCDRISSALFCPTSLAVKNLAHEGITQGVYRVGDVMGIALEKLYHW